MVVRINTGKSIQGVLRYNELKRDGAAARLIGHQGFLTGAENLTIGQLAKRFEELTSLNRRTKTNAVHISLNFAPGEKLSYEKLKAISKSYLERIGFGNQPCLIYEHLDAGHPHVHLVTVNIDRTGHRIETHNLGRNQSEVARKSIEWEFGLVPAEKQERVGPSLQELGKLVYGQESTKSSINTVLNQVWNNYVFSSFGEYNAILSGFGVTAYRGEKTSIQYQRGGLVYHVLDLDGKRKGVPIKASSFYLKPTLKKLWARFPRDLVKKKELLAAVQLRVSGVLQKSKSVDDFQQILRKEGMQVVLNYAQNGQLFGATYVDHLHRVGVKGSDLGKEFGANALVERFGLEPKKQGRQKENSAGYEPQKTTDVFPILPEITPIPAFQLTLSDSPYQEPVMKGNKKRKKKKNPNSSDS